MTNRVLQRESEWGTLAQHAGPTVSHVVGARPNFMKAAPVIGALRTLGVTQRLIHTGQHYSDNLSDVFFRELDLPSPDVNLGVGSGTQAGQTAQLMLALEDALVDDRPDLLVLYGDVNSTLAAAVVAVKLGIPIAHVEAGLRSFDRSMPEEINRVVVDALADVLLVTSAEGIDHLVAEGRPRETIHLVGNPMIDTMRANESRFDPDAARRRLSLPMDYAVATIHRPANVDEPARAAKVVAALNEVAGEVVLVVPLHPRGRATLSEAGLADSDRLRILEPLGYIDFMSLVKGARLVVTDSGGVQEETTVFGVPCLTVRPNTERPITVIAGTNRLATLDGLADMVRETLRATPVPNRPQPPLWDGAAGSRIAGVLAAWLGVSLRRQ